MSRKRPLWYVVDYGGVYNVFSSDDFDEDGRYSVNPEYTLDDFDIIHKYTTADAAWNEAERLNRLHERDNKYWLCLPSKTLLLLPLSVRFVAKLKTWS